MRFSGFGGYAQMLPTSEGGILKQLGLLHFTDSMTHVDVEPTYTLRSMFLVEPPMEELYPLLVEFTMRFRFPKMVVRAEIERKLLALGMTGDGLDQLNQTLRSHFRIWDSDF